ncbi:MAG: IclR family transcriptional regulator [Actinomycetota bacterium]|nr:IclR family transcriptional regulator [Actinomycetota bacterium]
MLDLFREHQTLGAAECARELDMPRASAHRMLVSLRVSGVLDCSADGQYRLALALFELGSLVPLRRYYRQLSQAPLKELCLTVKLPAHLAIREDQHLVYVKKASYGTADRHGDSGQRGSLHATASGKVLLAFAPDDVVADVVAAGLERFTAATLQDGRTLADALAKIRDVGYAREVDESLVGRGALAVPIRNEVGAIVASLSLSGPTEIGGSAVPQLLPAIRRTARIMESRLRARLRGHGVKAASNSDAA